MDLTHNTMSNNSSRVSCVFFAAGNCLLSHCIATVISSHSTIPVFRYVIPHSKIDPQDTHTHTHTHTVSWSHKPLLLSYGKQAKILVVNKCAYHIWRLSTLGYHSIYRCLDQGASTKSYKNRNRIQHTTCEALRKIAYKYS
jgi:hypothetical protein